MEKYKPGLTLFSILTILVILFPPIYDLNEKSFSFIFSIPRYFFINTPIFIIELIVVFFISLLYQLNNNKIKKWFKDKI